MKMSVTALALTFSITALAAQDPLSVLPDSYLKQFENEWVRVVRVRYAPHAKLPVHAHNSLPAAYVYLNDGGPVVFKHIGASYGAATRPATKAGAFRVFRGIDEIHEVENTAEVPSEFLRVEFKTDAEDVRTLKGKFFREAGPDGEDLEHVQFQNDQVRITRVICAAGRFVRFATSASEPALLIALGTATLLQPDGLEVNFRLGQERWIPINQAVTFENRGPASSEFLRFDFKTAPISSSIQR